MVHIFRFKPDTLPVLLLRFGQCLSSCLEKSDQSARGQDDVLRSRGHLNLILFFPKQLFDLCCGIFSSLLNTIKVDS